MSGVIVKFTGMQELEETSYSFSVQSSLLNLPNTPNVDAPLRPSDALFVDLARLVSDPSADTPLITNAGQALHGMLSTHPNTISALPSAVHANAASPGRSIKLHFPDYAEEMLNLPWETLYDPTVGFLDNDAGLPVLRVVDTKPDATQPKPNLASDGIRVLSVIAAHTIDGLSEFKAMLRAFENFAAPWTMHVYSPNQTVIDEIARIAHPSITHHHVPGSANALMADIAAFRPQICHFFCHGVSIGQGPARLELETRGSDIAGAATVEVKASQLASTLPSSAWLVLLNACNSGEASSDSGSLAASLVANGVPAVVGMREPTQTRTLNTFTEGFLDQALVSIAQLLSQGAPFELDLGPSVTAGRNAICASFRQPDSNPAERVKDWSLPVIVVGTNAFQVEPGVAPDIDLLLIARLEGERNELTSFLDRMNGRLGAAKADAIRRKIEQIDDKIETALA